VLDGQQRLRTLHTFYEGILNGRQYRLERVQKEFNGKTYTTLDPEDRRRLDNSIIHATVVRQDEPTNDQSSIYMIFERLNTGGTILQPQEIRVALYSGAFIDFLHQMNDFEPWRKIYGPKSKRLKDQELILRFFALLYRETDYKRPMKEFLNMYMSDNREFELHSREEMGGVFQKTVRTVFEGIGQHAFRPQRAINVAIMDSVMVGIARRIQEGRPITDLQGLSSSYESLVQNDSFLEELESGTTAEDSVHQRINTVIEVLEDLD
jgi:hypothetical protein